MNLLVTGGCGFVGSHFVRAAVEAGHRVVVVDDLSGGAPAPSSSHFEFVRADIGDTATVREVLAKQRPQAAVHFAGKIQVGESVRDPATYWDVNVARSLTFLAELRRAGVAAVVYSSTAAVYGAPDSVPIAESASTAPINPYGATKLAFERALEHYGSAYGLRWAALRYFNAAGAHPSGDLGEHHRPETHLIPLAIDAAMGRTGPLQIFGAEHDTPDGTCIRDYVHVCDLADAHLRALDELANGHSIGALNLGTGHGTSVREVLQTVGNVLGRSVPQVTTHARRGDPASLVASVHAAATRLGWRARYTDIREIVEDAARARRQPPRF